MPEENKPSIDPVKEYENKLKSIISNQYTAIDKRLQAETNIILRYDLKLSRDTVLQTYRLLFPEEK